MDNGSIKSLEKWNFQWTCEIKTEGVLIRPLELVQGRDMLGKGRCKKKRVTKGWQIRKRAKST